MGIKIAAEVLRLLAVLSGIAVAALAWWRYWHGDLAAATWWEVVSIGLLIDTRRPETPKP